MPLKIRHLRAWEILDSRGNPTVAARCELDNGVAGVAHAPSGASTGRHEALELRDGDLSRYSGKGVLGAIRNVHELIDPALLEHEAEDQAGLDRKMIELDGTPEKSRLGANATVAVSCAVARAVALAQGIPLWRYLAGTRQPSLPVPMTNILSGGLHGGGNIEFQDFLVIPDNSRPYGEQLESLVRVHREVRELLDAQQSPLTGVADEGGWAPRLASNEAALILLARAIERNPLPLSIAIDVASSHFYNDGIYTLRSEHSTLTSAEMIARLLDWTVRYPLVSIEDGLAEDDWDGWKTLTTRLGANVQLVGDDLFCTNPARLRRGIGTGAANSILIKMNQIGTLTETFEVIDLAIEAGYGAVISARSGETEDSFLADLATASGAGQIKIGSITRSERLAKYNRLLEIEAELPLRI